MPKIKFNINGMNAELPAALSQRRNSALQSLFNTTSSLGSALNSARGNGGGSSQRNYMNSTQGLAEQLSTQVNLESTQELKAFATVDLVKINKERSYQLKMALEDNLKEKDTEIQQIQSNYRQQKEEYEKLSKRYSEKSGELEHEINKQKQHIINLKEQLRQIEAEHKNQIEEYSQFDSEINSVISNCQEQITKHQKLISENENELQVLKMQKKGLLMSIEMQKKVKTQELDMKVNPLKDEREKIQMHLDMLDENLRMLLQVKNQNENERMMIQEDLMVSESIKIDQVFQREELEGYLEKLKSNNEELNFITSQHRDINWEQNGMQEIIDSLVLDKQKNLLLDLIRELQQYILGMSSGTTDNSVLQSDELEELEYLIEKRKIDLHQAVEVIVEFAQRKLNLNIGSESLIQKLSQITETIDIQNIKDSLTQLQEIEQQMKVIDCKIKVVYNRCQNELRPRFKALSMSQEQFDSEIGQAQGTIHELEEYIIELDKEIQNIQSNFEETYQPNDQEYEEIESKLNSIQVQIQDHEYNIDNYKAELQKNEIQKIDAINSKSLRDTDFDQYKQHYSQISSQLKEQLKREKLLQSEGISNPIIEELSILVAQIKCDKESASKRLSYVESKLRNAQDSVQHAQSVLDNHILQAQQEQLNQKVQTNNGSNFNMKRHSAFPSSSNNQLSYGPTQTSRMTNIQQKGQTLQHGQVLSPSKEDSRIEKSRNMSLKKEPINYTQVYNEQDSMHSHFIDQNQSQMLTEMKKVNNRSLSSAQKQPQSSNTHQVLNNQRSSNDMVRYYESSSNHSSLNSELSNHLNQFISNKPINQRNIPIQNLITPRDPLQELQNLKQNNNNFIYETHQQMSAISNDSINNSTSKFDRKMSIYNESVSNFQDTQTSAYQQNRNQQRAPLRQHNSSSSIEGSKIQQSNTKNVIIPLYSQFKENITPNNNISILTANDSSFNMRKLSQASNISQISNQSILNTIQTISQTGNRPPAVPQSKMYTTSGMNSNQHEDTTPIQSHHKTRTASMRMNTSSKHNSNLSNSNISYVQSGPNTRNSSKDSFISQPNKTVQTKIKLQVNVKNTGRPIQAGFVDFSKCQQSSKDSQFFESIKNLIEGAQFLVAQDNQYVLKQFYLDFSLMRIFMVNFNGDKEIIMIENIIKPEMPQSTLDQIRQEKNSSPSQSSNSSFTNQSGKRYEFNLIVNIGGQLERLQILAMSYEELRQWIVGINALLQNRRELMRLSSNIISISN
eukprot:403339570